MADATVRREFAHKELRSGVTLAAVVPFVKDFYMAFAKVSFSGKASARTDSSTMTKTCLIGFFKVTKGREMFKAGARMIGAILSNAAFCLRNGVDSCRT